MVKVLFLHSPKPRACHALMAGHEPSSHMSGCVPKASVIVCTYDSNRIKDLVNCVASLENQTYSDFEILIVVDHNPELYERLKGKWKESSVRIILNERDNKGQASAMNRGIDEARGEITCFIDDDASASPDWLYKLLSAYDGETIAAGGRTEPVWMAGKPSWLPEEFYWLVGATGNYFGTEPKEVRNLWSGNVSFRRRVFRKTGKFTEDLGRFGPVLLQGEDAEFGLRLTEGFGKGIQYVPDAVIFHKVNQSRTSLPVLTRRAFLQGYSKALIARKHKTKLALLPELRYLARVLRTFQQQVWCSLVGPGKREARRSLLLILLAMIVVPLGFLCGLARRHL